MSSAVDTACRCGSIAKELRQKRASNGSRLVAYQCLSCGAPVGSWLRQASIPNVDRLPAWDDGLIERAWEQKDAARDRDLADRRAQYNQYLRTEEWRSRRNLVLIRARGKCEGCGVADATEVHHLTYRHCRAEFLFELVALCHECHDRWHGFISKEAPYAMDER